MSTNALEFGTPAEWAAQQKWKRRGTAMKSYGKAGIGVAVCVAVLVVLSLPTNLNTTVRLAIAAVALVVASIYAYKAISAGRHAWTRSVHAQVGVRSEKQVRSVIRRVKHVAAVYGAKLGPRQGDVDLILVDPSLAVGAVEIKTGGGKVQVSGNQVRAGRKTIGRDPIGQTLKAARRLDQSLNIESLPVLCIPGMTNRPFVTEQGVVVCSAKQLVSTLTHYGHPQFSHPQEAEDACTSLWRKHQQYS